MPLLNEVKKIFSKKTASGCETRLTSPQTYFLELTNHCNLRCSMCNFHSQSVSQRRKKGYMSPDFALRLLNEISDISAPRPWVALHGAGEPLLHKDLIVVLQKSSHLKLDIGFLTNGVLLNDEIARKLMDTNISWIGFSIDGIDKEKFNKYRCGADYEQVAGNALNFIETAKKHRPDIKITINMTVQDEMKRDIPDFIKFWLNYVNELSVSPCRPIGTRDNELAREMPAVNRIPCYMLFTMMVIYWDGSVGLCCEDWFNDGDMGNVTTGSIEFVWNGRKFTKYRSCHKKGIFSGLTLCEDCNSWYNSIPQTYFDSELGCQVTKNAWQYVYSKPNL